MPATGTAAQEVLRRLLESERNVRSRVQSAEEKAESARAEARRRADAAIETARAEADREAEHVMNEALAEAERLAQEEDRRLDREIADADAEAAVHHEEAVARVVRWVTGQEP
jgi:F0F1-type ATP synthase membrane subunit b/b'